MILDLFIGFVLGMATTVCFCERKQRREPEKNLDQMRMPAEMIITLEEDGGTQEKKPHYSHHPTEPEPKHQEYLETAKKLADSYHRGKTKEEFGFEASEVLLINDHFAISVNRVIWSGMKPQEPPDRFSKEGDVTGGRASTPTSEEL